MRVVLVNPMVTIPGYASYYGATGRRACSLPHGLLNIATELHRVGHYVKVIDMRVFPAMLDVIQAIIREHPQVIGCGAMTVDFGVLLELFKNLKASYPQATTIAGGVHVSAATEDAAKYDCIDYIVTGEAEWTLTKMLDTQFVGFGRIVKGEPPDLDLLLPINREFMDYRRGELQGGVSWCAKAPYITIASSRGCPYKCRFCAPISDTMFGPARQRSVSHLISECRWLRWRYKAAYFEFIDDYFTHRPAYVEEFTLRWEKEMEKLPFNVATRADTITSHPAMFERLREVGLDTVNVGFESGSDRVLKFLRKGTTAEINKEAGKILNKLGIKIIANVMFGIPDETMDEAWSTITMLREMKADCPSPAFFTPYPGCELHEEFKDKLISQDYAQQDRYAKNPKLRGVNYEPVKALVQTELMRHVQEGVR